jgi:predicted extracellular nuclease
MRRWIGAVSIVGLAVTSLLHPARVAAASTTVTISELQTGSTLSASQEFVELYNQSDQDVSLAGWTLDYKSATGSSWTHKVTLTGTIRSHGFYLLAASGYAVTADQSFASGLSGTGGHLRVVDGATVIDLVGWGTAVSAEGGHAADAPAAGQSIERLPGRLNDTGGNGIDTDDNAADFIIRTVPEPQSTLSTLESPDLTPPVIPDPLDDVAPAAPTYLSILITELLIDPASPKTDASDEYIELYNPNDQDVDLAGYTLRTGSNFHDYYILPTQTLAAGQYAVFYSSTTHLGLTNAGGGAQLLNPAGTAVSQTQTYGQAKSNVAWALFDGLWKWTTELTPAAANVLAEPEVLTAASLKTTNAKESTAKRTTVKPPKSSTKSAKSTKAPAAKASSKTAFASVKDIVPQASLGQWLIIGLATLTIGYAIYEFRTDLQNYIYLAQRKFAAWRAHRTRP